MLDGETTYMGFIDHRLMPGGFRRTVTFPSEFGFDDHAQGRAVGIVSAVKGQVFLGVPNRIPEHRIRPLDVPAHDLGIRVQQYLVRVEAMAVFRLVGTMDPISIKLTWPYSRKITMPNQVGLLT